MMKKNKYSVFTPLMNKNEYTFIEKYLSQDDILLEWGSGNSTLYFSGIVDRVISIEHDIDYYYLVKNTIDSFNINNINLYYVPKNIGKNREEQFFDYIQFPIKNNLKFHKILIDGRARKYCAMNIHNYINEDVVIFIHDFNFSNVEGYDDDNYFNDILNYYDIIERNFDNQGIVSLRKKIICEK